MSGLGAGVNCIIEFVKILWIGIGGVNNSLEIVSDEVTTVSNGCGQQVNITYCPFSCL